MNVNELSQSNYLKKEDCMPPLTVTISGLTNENMAKDGQPEEKKYVLQFMEAIKPMVLNITNGQLIALVTGSEETDDWIGKKITLYNDPSISFGGKLTGGIRVQIPQAQVGEPQAREQVPEGKFEDDKDIPF